MKQYERFAECMKRLLKERHISTAELARMMGFKSRNSLFRILNDSTSNELEAAFYADLKEKDVLHLNPAEITALDEALEISRVGYSDYCSNEAIGGLLMSADAPVQEYFCLDVEAGQSQPFDEVMAEYALCKQVDMQIFSCCSSALFSAIANALKVSNCQCAPSIIHYMYAGSDEIVQNIVAIQPLLYMPWYKAYLLEPDSCAPETEAIFRASFIMTHLVLPDGTDAWDEFLMVDSQRMCRVHLPSGGYYRFIEEMVAGSGASMRLMKRDFGSMIHEFTDYFAYVEQYRLLEKNRDVYSLKPDVPINFIHPDLLLGSIMEGMGEQNVDLPQDLLEKLIKKLYQTQLLRYENFFTKKKVTHTVFSRKAMDRFVFTGHQSDHFYAMRPYTRAERKAIMENLRHQAVNNPYFWLYLLKDEDDPQRLPAEITFYDGEGVLLTHAYTDYNLENGSHSEAMIDHPEFCRKYKSFFMKDLLVNHVLTYQETIAQLDEWIELLS